MPRIAQNSRRSRTSCSIIALATVMAVGATPAAAQSFNGAGVFNSGSGTITTGAGVTNIALTSQNSVITWTPTDNATGTGTNILFQNSGTTATFSRATDFAVLNKIVPADISRAIVMNGTVNSRVAGAQGGSVYFYSPSGFVFGGTSVFSVGSLVVTALPITVDGSGNFITNPGSDNTVVFGQAPNANATIVSGGTIDANIPAFGVGGAAGDSYVALVAPHVVQSAGSISVNGSAALVAAEAATISFSTDGLFDIQVTTGTTSSSGLDINGDIGGPTPVDANDKQGIYLVAVPKNQLLTMVIGNGADLGFTLANSAVDDNGVVVLSAGNDITNGQIGAKSAAPGTGTASFWFTGAHATNNLFGEATGDAYLYSVAPQLTTVFNNDVTVHANGLVSMQSSGAGASLTVAGNVSLSADRTGAAGQSVTAGSVTLFAQNTGTLSITGTTDLSADAIGGSASVGAAGNGQGGSIGIFANDGSTLTLSNLTTSAIGSGGDGLASGINAGNGTGGSLSISANNGGIINLNSPLLFNAEGHGGSASGAGLVGNGTGGNASILAGNNSTLTFNGSVTLDASGFGGDHSSGSGGIGTGGTAQTDLLNNATLTINGDLNLNADATGGDGGAGGNGNGGVANIGSDFGASAGSTMTVSGNTFVNANGYGGNASAIGGAGGDALGGDAFMGDDANSYTFSGNLTISAFASGGSSLSGQGGDAAGGTAALDGTGGNIHVGNTVSVVANAGGGDGASGGDGSGGFARIRSRNIDIDGDAFLSAGGFGGFGDAGNGGDGSGGTTQLRAQSGSVSIGGAVFANADGNGGGSDNSGSQSGNGFGGSTNIEALSGGNLGIVGGLLASADGFGGGVFGFGTNGGDGTGGFAFLQASGANAIVTLGSSADVTANGKAGDLCTECGAGGIGGDGFGGSVTVQAFGAATASMSIASTLTAEADGQGGDGVTGNGGDGEGGTVYLGANDGANLHLGGTLFASAEGNGGYAFGAGDGGQGIGGMVSLNATSGGTLTMDFGGYLDADGYGGDAGIVSSGDGGDGFGGLAGIYASGGTVDIGGTIFASGSGEGGFSDNARGGDGFGKGAEAFATQGGSLSIGGSLFLDAYGTGGDGFTGGNGIGGGDPVNQLDGAHVFARNADITINGSTIIDASGIGGDGSVNNQISGTGGAGGSGTGGWATIFATNDDLGPSSIDLGIVSVSANAIGGAGGTGGSGNLGGTGGAGGNAVGGVVSITAAAGNGTLSTDDVFASATATGGTGGNGGNGDTQAGGNGGNGGNATGGLITIGTESGPDRATASNLGVATYGAISANSSAVGGDGGTGNFGNVDGIGGNGGNAKGGGATLLVRGSTVNAGNVSLLANATGGSGGFGPSQGPPRTGNGGNATVGGVSTILPGFDNGIHVVVTERYLHPTQRGKLNAGAITGSAVAIGGAGAASGFSQTLGHNGVIFRSADGDLGSIDFTIGANSIGAGATEDAISVKNGDVTFTGELRFDTDGTLSLFADNGSMTSNSLYLSAANFVPDTVDVTPAIIGTYFADSATILTGNNFLTTADLDIGSSLVINAPGFINAHNFTIDGDLDLLAQGGNIVVNDLEVNGYAHLYAYDSILADDITTTDDMDLFADLGDITLDDLIAGLSSDPESTNAIRLDAGGSLSFGEATAKGRVRLLSGGPMTGGNVTSGLQIEANSDDTINLGNLSAGLIDPQGPTSDGFSIGIQAAKSITVGNVEGAESVGFVTLGGLTTGDITAGDDVLGLVADDITMGDISAGGRVYLANVSMFIDAGGPEADVDPEVIFGATPVPTGGSILVGDVVAGSFQAAAGTSLTTGTINTDGGIDLHGGGAITTGDIIAGDFVLANGGSITLGNVDSNSLTLNSTAGNITTGDVSAFGAVEFDAFGDIIAGDITAGSIDLFAGDDITTGDLTTQQLVLLSLGDGIHTLLFPGASITLESGGDILTGNISSIDGVYADAGGSLTTGTIDAFDFVQLLAVNNILTDDIAAGDFIDIFSSTGGIDTGDLAGTDIELDAAGAIAFDDVNGYDFDFSAGSSVTGGNIVVAQKASGDAGGTINLGNITAGPFVPFDDFSVGIAAIGNITVGNVSGAGPVGFATQGNLTTGSLTSGNLVMTLVGGNITTGAITTTDEFGEVYMADDSMFLTGGGTLDGEGDFDASIVLALDPVATGGSITINGPVDTGLFRAAAGTSLTTQAITAGDIEASAGGTAKLNGIWATSGSVTLSSNDIDITGTGGINAQELLTLISTNGTQMQIGDGLPTGAVYALSNAEFGRISGYEVDIVGRGDASSPFDMLVGDLNVTGPLAGSNVEGADGALVFAVGNINTMTPAGVIRVVGDVNATGFGADNAIEFHATRFELDAGTGSISIFSSGSTLGGILSLDADRIHVASASILDKLANNPTYTNYQQDLDKAATVQRPEGVLRADTLFVDADGLQDLLIQNTGSFETRAGFLVRDAEIPVEDAGSPAGSINLVVNGQVVTDGGTLTGVAARDALVTPEDDITAFTSNSTINGCPLTGECIIRPPPPPPVANVVDNQIDLITGNPLGDSEFGNEDSIDDNEEGNEGANNPIAPPQPLFDTRPLIPSSDVNDPVSGTGNPALLGSEGECDADDEAQCTTKKEGGQ